MSDLAAVVLVGGLGSRLGERSRLTPKPLLEVGGRPFVAWVLDGLAEVGADPIVLASGHRAERVAAFVDGAADGLADTPGGAPTLVHRAEQRPLGTGGALLAAAGTLPAGRAVLCHNGDTLVGGSLAGLVAAREATGADAVLLASAPPAGADPGAFGTLAVDGGGALRAFREKAGAGVRGSGRPVERAAGGSSLVYAGVAVFAAATLDGLAVPFDGEAPVSLERDLFPGLLTRGADLRVHVSEAPFLDIGTPADLARAPAFVAARHPAAAAGLRTA